MLDIQCMQVVQERFDNLIKPVGSLAKLEKMVGIYAGARRITQLDYPKKALVLLDFAGDNLSGQINCLQAALPLNCELVVVAYADLKNYNLDSLVAEGVEVIAFGVSAKAGHSEEHLPEELMAKLCELMLQANNCRIPVVLDGLLTVAAAHRGYSKRKQLKDYLIASYKLPCGSQARLLQDMELSELLSISLQSENGLGALLVFGLLDAGIRAYKDMRTFDEARVEYALADLK